MSAFTKTEMKRTAVVSGALALAGLLMVLATRGAGNPEDFWHPYRMATGGMGWMLLLLGVIWVGLSSAHWVSDFFDLQRAMDGGAFAGTVGAIIVAMLILLAVIMPRLPHTPASRLPLEPKAREQIVRSEANFKLLVLLGIVASGVAVGSVPFRRFFRK